MRGCKGKNLGRANLSKNRTAPGRLKSYCDERGIIAFTDVQYEHWPAPAGRQSPNA